MFKEYIFLKSKISQQPQNSIKNGQRGAWVAAQPPLPVKKDRELKWTFKYEPYTKEKIPPERKNANKWDPLSIDHRDI